MTFEREVAACRGLAKRSKRQEGTEDVLTLRLWHPGIEMSICLQC